MLEVESRKEDLRVSQFEETGRDILAFGGQKGRKMTAVPAQRRGGGENKKAHSAPGKRLHTNRAVLVLRSI